MESDRWASDLGDKWNLYHNQFEEMIAEAGTAIIDHAKFQPNERVVDVGCGAGVTSLLIAKQASQGHVTGLDLSETLVNTCRQRANNDGLVNIDFVCADATTAVLNDYDRVFSRFGVMFFDDPVLAFKNIRNFLRHNGKMTFACWGPPPENPWVFEFMGIIKDYLELPPPMPNAPGPFAFADPNYLEDVLNQAGFQQIDISSWSGNQWLGGSGANAEAALKFILNATFVGEAIENEPEDIQERIRQALLTKCQTLETNQGIAVKGTIWMVNAIR